MQKNDEKTNLDKLSLECKRKVLFYLSQCLLLENQREEEFKERKEILDLLEKKIENINKENIDLDISVKNTKFEVEELLKTKEGRNVETDEFEEKLLEDLKEKHVYLNNEIKKFDEICQQFDDPNFLYMNLTNWDFFSLTKFLADLNNHIHHINKD